jgi:hypothetical protein
MLAWPVLIWWLPAMMWVSPWYFYELPGDE